VREVVPELVPKQGQRRAVVEQRQEAALHFHHHGSFDKVDRGVLTPARLIQFEVTSDAEHALRLARLLVCRRGHGVGQPQRLGE
jgi:hypothetical protein